MDRRGFLIGAAAVALGLATRRLGPEGAGGGGPGPGDPAADLTLFLCGDVMTGRGATRLERESRALDGAQLEVGEEGRLILRGDG